MKTEGTRTKDYGNYTFRCKQAEREAWKEAAQREGRTTANWIRRACNLLSAPAADVSINPNEPSPRAVRPARKRGSR